MNKPSRIRLIKQTEVAREGGEEGGPGWTASERTPEGAMLEPHERAGWIKFLEVSFGLHELKSLAFELGADYPLFSHSQPEPLVLDLVRYCECTEQLGLLVAKVIQQRPEDAFLALLQAKLPPSLPRTKVQIVLALKHGAHLNRQELEGALADFFGVPQDQVALMGLADIAQDNFQLLVSLPHGTAFPQVQLGSHKLAKAKYEIFFVTALDALDPPSQKAWRTIVTNHPPRERSTELRPTASWKRIVHGREIEASSSGRATRVWDRPRPPGSRFLPRIPRVAWGIALLALLSIAVLGVLAMQNANRRSRAATQVSFVQETTTAIVLETVNAQRSIAETATAVAMLPITPSRTATATSTLTPTPTLTPTLTPTPTMTASPTSTAPPTPTATRTPTRTSTPTRLPTHMLTPTLIPTRTLTPTAPPTVMPTATATRTPTHTPALAVSPTPTVSPAPTHPSTSGPSEVPIQLAPGACVAIQSASIYDRLGLVDDLQELGVISQGENVTRLGSALSPWESWIKVRRPGDNLEGFVWGARFECESDPVWPQLEIVRIQPYWYCDDQQKKRAGLIVVLQGGNGLYTFSWEGQDVTAIELEQPGEYLVNWPWGAAPAAGKLTVISGDGQSVESAGQFIREPSCQK